MERLEQIMDRATTKTLDILENGEPELQAVVGAWTRGVHDWQLLSGAVTERIESSSKNLNVSMSVDDVMALQERAREVLQRQR